MTLWLIPLFLAVLLVGDQAGYLLARTMRLLRSIPGCCDMCSGTGASGDPYTNGMCWDCRATGHPHTGLCDWGRRWPAR